MVFRSRRSGFWHWRRRIRLVTRRWYGGGGGGGGGRRGGGGRLGITVGAGAPAVGAGLVEFGARVRFCHPLLRSAAYRSAPVHQMQETHAALAEATDPAAASDRGGTA